MALEWREAMSVGDENIDADHKHLIDLINEFGVAISGKIEHKQIAHVLLGLVEYTTDHFKREEELQLKVRYPYHDAHKKMHRDVLKQLSAIVTEYTQSPPDKRIAMIRDLAGFLKTWLVDHIIDSDLRMKPYVLKMQQDQAEAIRRRRAAIAQQEHMAGVREG
jgi:hemerythrin